ncbi:hypothetical protein PRIPAC_75052 [Pristionchus pacificus]|uniref:Membrane transporter n=1 Tax=Pristionchus pacificus TaxID=54126 RepID=A0A2A6C060_PRIPA|nr:hypothetical protein PRIPAC_75052 [Pristionchus pacificus]|eukprot:PDM71411.1 membrane transporter [Pristionchus pacificus]
MESSDPETKESSGGVDIEELHLHSITERDGCLNDCGDPGQLEKSTKLRAITLVAAIYTLSCITMQSVAQTGYLYLMMIDRSISPNVFFFSYGAAKVISQFVSLIIVSLYTNRTHRYKVPLMLGRVFALCGVCLYLALGIIDHNWRVAAYLTSFVFIGFGEGTAVLCRGYAPKYSSIENRSAALGIMTAAGMGGVLFGPAVNLSFASLKERALSHWGGIIWNIFTLPLLILIGLNITAIILSLFVEEPTFLRRRRKEQGSSSNAGAGFASIRRIINEEAKVVDPSLWRVSMQMKAATAGSFFAVLTGLSQHFDATFNLTKEANIELLSKCQIGAGVVSAVVACSFIFGRLGSRKLFHPTLSLVYSLFAFSGMSLITLSWPWADRIAVRGAMASTGCDPIKYDWCYDTKQIGSFAWIVAGGFLLGISMPMTLIAQDTLFSRVIENSTRRDLHQGFYGAIECLILTIVPPISGPAYVKLGPHYFYAIIGFIQLAIFFRFLPFMRKYKEM